MTEPQKQLVKQWVLKAENDLLNVTNNLQADRYQLRFLKTRSSKQTSPTDYSAGLCFYLPVRFLAGILHPNAICS